MTLAEYRTKLFGVCGLATVEKAFDLYSELEVENEQLKKEVADYHRLQWQHDALIDENERLKGENAELIERAKWNAREQRRHNENMRNKLAKMKCLALLLASEMYRFKSMCNKYEGSDWWVKMKRQCGYYNKSYRKAKKALKEGK